MNTQNKQEINTKIEELKKTIAELEAKINEPEQQPWIPHGDYDVSDSHIADLDTGTSCNRFISREAAQYAAEKLKPIYKLLSYVTEFDKDEYGCKRYCVAFTWRGQWETQEHNPFTRRVDAILMSKRCAEELVDKLNKGLVKLD